METKGSGLKSTSINGVKRYMISSQQSNTASWVGPKKHRPSRKDKNYQQKIELVQDLTFPTATSTIKVTLDGEFLIASEEDEVEYKQIEEENTDAETAISLEDSKEKTEEEREELPELEGIPIAPSAQTVKKPGVIVVLEKASLEVAKVGKNYQILNSEEHANFLRRNNKNPADYRPDIVYQALLSILDSPLNKVGCLRAVYVKTDKGVLFEVKPYVRIPRTYKRFAGIMLQLLQKLSIAAVGKREKLLRVIKNPVTQYLPLNSRKIGFSHSSDKVVEMEKYVAGVGGDTDLVFVVGAMSHGKIECDYIDDFISVSEYPLSAAWCIARVCEGVSKKWRVL